jgi:hypothetical protein
MLEAAAFDNRSVDIQEAGELIDAAEELLASVEWPNLDCQHHAPRLYSLARFSCLASSPIG